MSNNNRVFNVSRGFALKHKQAVRAVENCAAAWVVFGVSIRDVTLAEAIAARNVQASLHERLPLAEIPGLVFRMPAGREEGPRAERRAALEADEFAIRATA